MAVGLQNTAGQWRFVSEAALEDFVWEHLHDLFQLTPLERQSVCQGEVCDILAINAHRQLHILELKNSEDRYLTSQLTRYYANLNEVKPLADQIDYDRPVCLIGIAPTFHRHNFIDQQYSTLEFDLWQFRLSQQDKQVWFHLKAIGSDASRQLSIPSQFTNLKPNYADAPMPPEVLLSWLSGCTQAEQAGILRLRANLLAGSNRIQEAIDGNWIRYGSGKTKRCCEIYFQRQQQRPVLFLWLPTPASQVLRDRKPLIRRVRLWLDGITVSHVGHIAQGLGNMKPLSEWSHVPKAQRPKCFRYNLTHRSHTPVEVETYLRCPEQVPKPDYWEVLAEMVLEAWHQRI